MNEKSFLNRIIRDLHKDYECREASYIMIDKYFFENKNSEKLKEKFYMEKVKYGDYTNRSIRKLLRTNDFQEWCYEFLFFEIKNFNNFFDFNQLELFRAIQVDFDFIDKAKNASRVKLGIYWTYDYKYAIPYNSSCQHGDEYIFHAKINKSSVNIFKTFLLYVFNIYGEDEKEVRLFENKKIKNLFIEKKGDVLFSDFRFKTCIA